MSVIDINVSAADIENRKGRYEKAYRFEEADRVPVLVPVDAPLLASLAGIAIEDYWTDPEAMLRAQLYGQKYVLENIECDNHEIAVCGDVGAVASPASLGCELVPQEGSLPWVKPWVETEQDLLRLEKIDYCRSGLHGREIEFREEMTAMASKYKVRFKGGEEFSPAKEINLSGSSHGPITTACAVRGGTELFVDLYERPKFAKELVRIIAEKEIEWIDFCRKNSPSPKNEIFFADDYAPYLSAEMYEEFALPYEKMVRERFACKFAFHLCVTADHLLDYLIKDLRIDKYTGFKPKRDFNRIREDMKKVADVLGGKVVLEPDLDPAKILVASAEEIYDAACQAIELFAPARGFVLMGSAAGGLAKEEMGKLNAISKAAKDVGGRLVAH